MSFDVLLTNTKSRAFLLTFPPPPPPPETGERSRNLFAVHSKLVKKQVRLIKNITTKSCKSQRDQLLCIFYLNHEIYVIKQINRVLRTCKIYKEGSNSIFQILRTNIANIKTLSNYEVV